MELIGKFAEVYGVRPERVVAGCGSDEVLHLLCRTLLCEGAEVVNGAARFLDVPPFMPILRAAGRLRQNAAQTGRLISAS